MPIEAVIFDPVEHFLQHPLGVLVIVADTGTGDYAVLPGIQQIDFSRRNIELAVQARQQWFQSPAFFF